MLMNKIKIFTAATLLFILLSSQGFMKTTVALTGNVFNRVSKVGETCNILVFDENGKRATATRSIGSQNGYYYLAGLKPGNKYQVKLRKKGFMKETIDIEIPNSDKYVELSRDFQIKPMKEGIKIPLAVSPFELRKSKLRVGADIFLTSVLHSLTDNETLKVKLVSYPDSGEDNAFNQSNTLERSQAIKGWLVNNGIAANRIEVAGSGIVDPNNPPPTEKAAKGKRYIGPIYYEIVSF